MSKLVRLAIRLLCGPFFIAAGAGKIHASASFAGSLAAYQLFPDWLISPIALTLPWWEALLGLCLLIGWRLRSAALAILGLLLTFEAILLVTLARGLDISCGCSTVPMLDTSPAAALLRNLFLIAGVIYLLRTSRRDPEYRH